MSIPCSSNLVSYCASKDSVRIPLTVLFISLVCTVEFNVTGFFPEVV